MKKEEPSVHWSRKKEQTAGYWQLRFLLKLFRIFPPVILRVLSFPVGFFYFLFSKSGRLESKRFLQKAAPFADNPQLEKKCRSPFAPLRHIISFSLTLIQKLETWSGIFPFENICFHDDDSAELIQSLETGKGAFLIISHLGNAELLRGLASFNRTGVSRKVPLTLIGDMNVTGNFTRMLNELNPQSSLDIINAKEMGPDTVVLLEERLAAGEMVTIAGDRTSGNETGTILKIPFLGEEAPFSNGIFYLAVLVNVPVYFIFAIRQGDLSIKPKYDMYVHKNDLFPANTAERASRKERYQQSSRMACSYAALLERYTKRHPFQWYNFFNFWAK